MENSGTNLQENDNQNKIIANTEIQEKEVKNQEESLLNKRKNNDEKENSSTKQMQLINNITDDIEQKKKKIKLENSEENKNISNNIGQQNQNLIDNVVVENLIQDKVDDQQNNLKKNENQKNNQVQQEFYNNQLQILKNTKENNQNNISTDTNLQQNNQIDHQQTNDQKQILNDDKNQISASKQQNEEQIIKNEKIASSYKKDTLGHDTILDDRLKSLEALLQSQQQKDPEDLKIYISYPNLDNEIQLQIEKYIESYKLVYESIDFQQSKNFIKVKFGNLEDLETFKDHQIQMRLLLGLSDLFYHDELSQENENQENQKLNLQDQQQEQQKQLQKQDQLKDLEQKQNEHESYQQQQKTLQSQEQQQQQSQQPQPQFPQILIPGQSQNVKLQTSALFSIPVPPIGQTNSMQQSMIPIPGVNTTQNYFYSQNSQQTGQQQSQQQDYQQYYQQQQSQTDQYYQQPIQQYQQYQQPNQYSHQQSYQTPQQPIAYDSINQQQQSSQFYQQQQQQVMPNNFHQSQSQLQQQQQPAPQNNQIISQYTLMRDTTKRIVPEANIFIKNLNINCTAQDLESAFSIYGQIVSIKIGVDSLGNPQGYGYIQFENVQAAENAVQNANNCQFMEQQITVQPFNSKLRIDPRNNLYVKNLPSYFSDDQLKQKLEEVFGLYGRITSSIVKMDTQLKKPFAFICFENHLYADIAFKALHDTDPMRCGCRLYISWAEKRGDRSRRLTDMHNTYQGFINPIQYQNYPGNQQQGSGGMHQQNNYYQYN